jgi:hypothetical protein
MTMEVGSQWYNGIVTEVSQYRLTLGPKNAKKYRLDQLLRVAKRIDDFSGLCAECQAFQAEISRLVKDLGLITQMPDRDKLKKYLQAIHQMTEHLKKVHHLVDKGHYTGIGIGIGMAIGGGIGTALGAALDNPGIGTGIGIALLSSRLYPYSLFNFPFVRCQ